MKNIMKKHLEVASTENSNNVKNKKNYNLILTFIIIFIIIIVIVIIVLSSLIFLNKKDEKVDNSVEEIWKGDNTKSLTPLKDNEIYYTLIQCISNYVSGIYEKNDERVYIDEWYTNNKNIEKENYNKDFFEQYSTYEPTEINYISKGRVYIYYIYGNVIRADGTLPSKKFNIIIKLDFVNYRYSIIPQIIEDLENKEIFGELGPKYNDFEVASTSNEMVASRYLLDYYFLVKEDINKSFDLIDEEYKKAKFLNDINNYKIFINQRYNENSSIPIIKECKVCLTEEFTAYIVKDLNGNIYIFKETAVNKYTVILDANTIKLDFLENGENNNEIKG